MKVIDVYEQYFAADAVVSGVARKGAKVTLTATSDAGEITYEATVTLFPHRDETDFAVSYDAYASEVLYHGKGRRSKKREAALTETLWEVFDRLAASLGGTIDRSAPLREARHG
ncbi:MAG: hypothetical protein E7423_00895 [Ruminococcaceae bacterium]|nr:hypothetical protein [Oscillospiraceae bacterium]